MDQGGSMNVIKQEIGEKFALYNADCVDVVRTLPDNSIDFSVYSPPFESLYVFSNSERDMGNNASSDDFWQHYRYLIAEMYRAMKPGRLIAIHCMNLPTSKARDGFIGLKDFRGEIIRAHQDAGFIYHSEVCIWKDPVVAMQRTKALGLLYKQLRKDSAMSRQGIADYLVVVRKPGDNPDPVTHTHESFTVDQWQQYASPVWMDIKQTRTLQYMSARESDDERHISPLQLDVIERAIELWTNPDDLVFTPFLGIGSEAYVALQMGRRACGSELKSSYFDLAVRNCKEAVMDRQQDLFALG
jgi:DNA modification methylase